MEQVRINLDFDGTIKKGSAIEDFSRICNDPKKAYGMAVELFQDSVDYVKSAYSIDCLVDDIESMYESRMRDAAKLMNGIPVSKMMEIKCEIDAELLSEIFRLSSRKPVNIISHNEIRLIGKSVESNGIPVHEILGTTLGDCNGVFDGTLKSVTYKSEAPSGHVFADEIGDIGMCRNASRDGYGVFVVRSGKGSSLLESALEKYGIEYGTFYNGKLRYNMSSKIMNPIAIPKM